MKLSSKTLRATKAAPQHHSSFTVLHSGHQVLFHLLFLSRPTGIFWLKSSILVPGGLHETSCWHSLVRQSKDLHIETLYRLSWKLVALSWNLFPAALMFLPSLASVVFTFLSIYVCVFRLWLPFYFGRLGFLVQQVVRVCFVFLHLVFLTLSHDLFSYCFPLRVILCFHQLLHSLASAPCSFYHCSSLNIITSSWSLSVQSLPFSFWDFIHLFLFVHLFLFCFLLFSLFPTVAGPTCALPRFCCEFLIFSPLPGLYSPCLLSSPCSIWLLYN